MDSPSDDPRDNLGPDESFDDDPGATPPPAESRTPPRPRRPRTAPRKRKSSGIWVVLLVMAGLFVFGCMAILLLALVAVGAAAGKGPGVHFEKTVVRNGAFGSDEQIALISLDGVIMGSGSPLVGSEMLQDVGLQFRNAAEDKDVKAVVIQVDSPGGYVAASDLLYHEVRRLQQTGKPVVVFVGSLAASGGYYVAAPADYIVASPTSMIGSIGIIMPRFEVKNLMKMIGVESTPVTAGKFKDLGSPFRDMKPEERAIFQAQLDAMHQRFMDLVAEGRKMSAEEVEAVATGEVWLAEAALERKLVDEVGYLEAALDKAEALAGISGTPAIIHYDKPFSFESLFQAQSGASLPTSSVARLEAALLSAGVPRALALWTGAGGR